MDYCSDKVALSSGEVPQSPLFICRFSQTVVIGPWPLGPVPLDEGGARGILLAILAVRHNHSKHARTHTQTYVTPPV